MRETIYIAPEIEEEEALWESLCITCEPTGAGLPMGEEPVPVTASLSPESRN